MMSLRNLVLYVVVALCLTGCTHCRDSHNFGYPREITFRAAGGSTSVSGDEFFTHFEVRDSSGNSEGSSGNWTDEYDTLSCTYQWLTVKCKAHSTQIELTAEPNPTSKERRLWIDTYIGYDYATVEVVQAGK